MRSAPGPLSIGDRAIKKQKKGKSMKRSNIKLARKQMMKENKKRSTQLTLLPREQWPTDDDANRVEVWLSNRYLAQVFLQGQDVLRVSVCRTMIDGAGEWEQNLSWDELMEVKRQINHAESYAVEVLPADSNIVNVANMRHFWVLPVPVVGWKKDQEAHQ